MARIEVDKLVKLSSEKKIDNVSEVFERREIKRNISNQIISYTLADGSNTKYGILRLPATQTVYNANQYNRAIDRLSDELKTSIVEITPTNQTGSNITINTNGSGNRGTVGGGGFGGGGTSVGDGSNTIATR